MGRDTEHVRFRIRNTVTVLFDEDNSRIYIEGYFARCVILVVDHRLPSVDCSLRNNRLRSRGCLNVHSSSWIQASCRAYASTAGLAVIFSAPYIPTYVFLVTNSVNLFSSAPLSLESVVAQLIYINARLSISAYLLIAASVFGFVMIAQARDKTGISMIAASSVAAIILVSLLNSTIFERAAYFLPIPFFLLIAESYRYLLSIMD